MREQVCKYMCPYARFQSAMFDKDTLIITYDGGRGEPRGPRARNVDFRSKGLGECIDCTLCVQACPTGIDIRQGLQYECIACAACIDACDSIMDKMGSPRGLVRYTTQHALDGEKTLITRPRIVVYATLLGLLIAGFIVALSLRTPLGLDVIRDRNTLYRTLDDGRVENVYTVKILNKTERARRFRISVTGPGRLVIDPDPAEFTVGSGDVFPAAVRVRRDAYDPLGSETIRFAVVALDHPTTRVTTTARFIAPAH